MNHTQPTVLVDRYGRNITYLRLSVTDRCDFRCNYCMADDMTFLPKSSILTLEECLRIARVFTELGVYKIRVTGGEPLVRRNVTWLLNEIAQLPKLKELVLTTNGSQLPLLAEPIKRAGVKRLNISLDSLKAERFKSITRVGDLLKVLTGIDAAIAAGFQGIKLNTVMMRGVNDDEFVNLVQYALEHEIDISFIEEMPLGVVDHARQQTYYSADEALTLLQQRFTLVASSNSTGGPARYWEIPGSSTRIGMITPHSHNFCGDCNRVRVTCTGELFPCLGQDNKVELMPALRDHPNDDQTLRDTIVKAMGIKPLGHDFNLFLDKPKIVRFMSMTGG